MCLRCRYHLPHHSSAYGRSNVRVAAIGNDTGAPVRRGRTVPGALVRNSLHGSESNTLVIAGEFEVAPAHFPLFRERAHGAFPVDGAGTRTRVEFLVVEQRFER